MYPSFVDFASSSSCLHEQSSYKVVINTEKDKFIMIAFDKKLFDIQDITLIIIMYPLYNCK